MKKYIFLTPELGTMGGTQMFVYNKGLYLKNQGWNVYYCYYTDSELKIAGFKDFKQYYRPEMIWGIDNFSKSRCNDIIKDICNSFDLRDSDEVVIESNLVQLSFWGEQLASEINGKHILNYLEEKIPSYITPVYSYFSFKLKRKEILNASKYSLKRLFQDYYQDEYLNYEHAIRINCSNVLSNEVYDITPYEGTGYNIISIGRLDKPYIPSMVNELKKVVSYYVDKQFNFIMVGGSCDGKSEEYIREIFKNQVNIRLFFLGYLFPVPLSLIKKMDLAIATSNSVLVTYSEGIPTIAVDANDYDAIGIYGMDTTNRVFRHGEQPVPIGKYVERVLFDPAFVYVDSMSNAKNKDDEEFESQLQYELCSDKRKQYYPVEGLYGPIQRFRGIVTRILYTVKHRFLR